MIPYKSLSSSILACRPSSSVTRCRSSAQRRQFQKKKKRKKLKKSSRKRNKKKKKKNSPIIIQADLKLNRRLARHSTKCHSETVINTAAYWWIVVMCAPFVARIHVPVTVMRSQSGSNFCRHPPPSLCLFPFSSHRWNRWCVHACTSYRFGRSRGHLLTGVWSGLPKPSRFSSLSLPLFELQQVQFTSIGTKRMQKWIGRHERAAKPGERKKGRHNGGGERRGEEGDPVSGHF